MRDGGKPAAPGQLPQGDFYPPNRLAEILGAPGGMTVNHALKQAAATLDAGESDFLRRIDDAIGELRRLGGGAPSMDEQGRMYDRSSEILALAVTVSYRDLSDAAFCLCELLDNQRQKGLWLADRVQVMLSAIGVLRKPAAEADKTARTALVAGLQKLAKLD